MQHVDTWSTIFWKIIEQQNYIISDLKTTN